MFFSNPRQGKSPSIILQNTGCQPSSSLVIFKFRLDGAWASQDNTSETMNVRSPAASKAGTQRAKVTENTIASDMKSNKKKTVCVCHYRSPTYRARLSNICHAVDTLISTPISSVTHCSEYLSYGRSRRPTHPL